jgi:hypothetical protein
VLIALVLALVAAACGDDDDGGQASAAGREILLEPASNAGPAPFAKTIGVYDAARIKTGAGATRVTVVAGKSLGTAGTFPAVPGGAPGLYGGSGDQQVCDPAEIVAFLADEPDKAAAWAGVLGIDVDEIPAYVADLTPVLLRSDTRVTNHGYADGRATPRQSVLEAGTAVLVDRFGVPRVRCACGNPLLEPTPVPEPTFEGEPWEGFDEAAVVQVEPAPEPLDEFVIVDVETGELFTQPAGETGATATTTAAPTTTSAAATTASSTATATATSGSSAPVGSTTVTGPTTTVRGATTTARGATSTTSDPGFGVDPCRATATAPTATTGCSLGPAVQADDVLGSWSGDWGNLYLEQLPDGLVVGAYGYDEGVLVGRLVDRSFRGTWCEVPTRTGPSDAGPVELTFVLVDGQRAIDGRWRYASEPAGSAWREDWNLTDRSTEAPDPVLVARAKDPAQRCAG